VLGVICVLVAIWYTIEARTFDGTAFSTGPVGPKTLPTAIGVLFGILSLYLIVKPDRSPNWPSTSAWWQIGLVVLSSYVYGRVMEPIGFIAASAAMIVVVGLLFRAPIRALVPAALIFPVATAYVFNNWLELGLPPGWWAGFGQ
jgi:putative tricarboxylic transport membrane protein